MYFHVLSPASLWSCWQNRLLPLEPLLWLADCTLSDTRLGLSLAGALTISLVNTAESHVVMFGYSYRRTGWTGQAGWGWEKRVIPWWHHTESEYETRCFTNIFLRMDSVKILWESLLTPFKSLRIIKAQKMYFTQYGPFKIAFGSVVLSTFVKSTVLHVNKWKVFTYLHVSIYIKSMLIHISAINTVH